MDSRCTVSAPGRNTILYGHNLQNKSMFGTLPSFVKKDYFTAHPTGNLFLGGNWYTFTICAYLDADAEDSIIYSIDPLQGGAPNQYWEYIRPLTSQLQITDNHTDMQLVTISTCSASNDGQRAVVVGIIEQNQ